MRYFKNYIGIKKIILLVSNWVSTIDHKMIGVMNLLFGMFGGLLGVWYYITIRLEFQALGNQILGGASHYYYIIITMHGLVMIFFSVMPILIGGFGNFLVPLQLGTCKLAFPKINNFAFWLLFMSFICVQFSTGGFVVNFSNNNFFNPSALKLLRLVS